MKFIFVILFSLTFSTFTSAKTSAFIKATGQKQGLFKGDSIAKGHEQTSEILSYSLDVVSPRDPATGMPTGQKRYKPLTIVKDWGASSNQFYTAMATNENLKEVRIDFFIPAMRDPNGVESIERTIVLTNANIAEIKDVTTTVNGDLQDAEEISFTFQKITITDKNGTVFSDDWEIRN